jgi:MFS superfamily sulfate permease-like transporter
MSINSVSHHFRHLKSDIPSSVVVFFVALPLCLGIALASGAPLMGGLVAGMAGGIVAGIISGSHTSVSGPAAGLAVIVLASIRELASYESFVLAVVFAGIIQIVFSLLNAGIIGNFVPSSVIKGMLAAIGIILIFKQIPHALGYDADYEGDESFIQPDGENTFSELLILFERIDYGAGFIAIISFVILLLFDSGKLKLPGFLRFIPGSIWVVFSSVAINEFLLSSIGLKLGESHLVNLPDVFRTEGFSWPDFDEVGNALVWLVAVKIAVVASLETLLSIEATDKLDPERRFTPTSRELLAQGTSNVFSGLFGGLPVTAVIVRSSANIIAGGKTKISAILHGIWLLVAVLCLAPLLNRIPLSALAVILIMVGFKLTKPELYKKTFKLGSEQFIPFVVTIVAILFTDLLLGVSVGFLVAVFFIVRSAFRVALSHTSDGKYHLIRLRNNVTFVNKALLRDYFEKLPVDSYLILDGTKASFIDKDITETIDEFIEGSHVRNITIEIKRSKSSLNEYFRLK